MLRIRENPGGRALVNSTDLNTPCSAVYPVMCVHTRRAGGNATLSDGLLHLTQPPTREKNKRRWDVYIAAE